MQENISFSTTNQTDDLHFIQESVPVTHEKTDPSTLIRKHPLWRPLELVPGGLAIAALLLPVILSIFQPIIAASFMIVYTVVWFFRSTKLSFNLYRSTKIVKAALRENWDQLINLQDHPEKIAYEIEKSQSQAEKTSDPKLKKQLQAQAKELITMAQHLDYLKKHHQYLKSKEILHAIIFVTYKESYKVIRESIESYTKSNYSPSKMILVLAGEVSDQANFLQHAHKIQHEFGSKFKKCLITLHPSNIPGEIKGKSANSTYAAKQLKQYLDDQKIPYDHVITSVFDADTVAHHAYFSELTFKYLTTYDRTEKCYQPTHMFHNNIWDVPVMIRMVALSCTFWRMAESMEKEKYKSFSSRSLSFKTIVEVNYWDPAIIPEDSRQFWTAYNVYNGRHRLVPIYSPVYMDAVLSENYVKTFKSQYSQLRRWAWGVCDFPFVTLNLWHHQKISKFQKIYLIFEFLKNSLYWSTGPLLITFMGFLPSLLNTSFRDTVLAYNLPRMMSNILTLASSGVFMCAVIGLMLMPKRPQKNWFGYISLCAQWLLIPIVSIILSAIPALDAQLRLMFGRYLEYKVTEKARK